MTAGKVELLPDDLRLLMRCAGIDRLPSDLAPALNEALKRSEAALAEADGVTDPEMAARVLSLADQWDTEAQERREQSVRDGLHPALAAGHREANLLRQHAADLRAIAESAGQPAAIPEPPLPEGEYAEREGNLF